MKPDRVSSQGGCSPRPAAPLRRHSDTSVSNRWAVWLSGDEDLHHRCPSRASFVHMPGEFDNGYAI